MDGQATRDHLADVVVLRASNAQHVTHIERNVWHLKAAGTALLDGRGELDDKLTEDVRRGSRSLLV